MWILIRYPLQILAALVLFVFTILIYTHDDKVTPIDPLLAAPSVTIMHCTASGSVTVNAAPPYSGDILMSWQPRCADAAAIRWHYHPTPIGWLIMVVLPGVFSVVNLLLPIIHILEYLFPDSNSDPGRT